MKISTEALRRLLFNVQLFSGPKTATAGSILLRVREDTLTAYASDDFVLYTETIAVSSSDTALTLSLDQVKILTKEIKDSTEEYTEVAGESVAEDSIWSVLVSLGGRDWVSDNSGDFYVNPKRLSNLYRIRLEDKEDQPIGLRHSSFEGQDVLVFIYGPRVRGIITSMSEEVLRGRGCFLWGDVSELTDPGQLEDSVAEEELSEPPPWDVESAGLDGVRREHHKTEPRYRVEYTDAVDTTIAPDHVDKEAFNEYGF